MRLYVRQEAKTNDASMGVHFFVFGNGIIPRYLFSFFPCLVSLDLRVVLSVHRYPTSFFMMTILVTCPRDISS